MLKQELLLKNNNAQHIFDKRRIVFKNGNAFLRVHSQTFTGNELKKIIDFLNYMISKYRNQKGPIEIELGEFYFNDKLVYILLECICYYLITERRQKISVRFAATHTIWSEGIRFSPLRLLDGNEKNLDSFIKKFRFDINKGHFRRVIELSAKETKPEYLSALMNEFYCFLQNNDIEESACRELSEVIAELVGNAIEHGKADCLVDLDITNEYINQETNSCCYGLNVCVVNFSEKNFYELLKEKIATSKTLPERYELILLAKKNHERFYNEEYTENDFFTIASFQHKISGSEKKVYTGGTGLTSLIKSLEEKSDGHWCYMLTRNRITFFKPEYMKYDENKLIGFNKNQEFINEIPDVKIFRTISTNLPGTAYNLNFALRKEPG